MSTIFKIDQKGVPCKLRKEIEDLLPKPLVVDGWKFSGYVWRKLSQINTKDEWGNTDNTVRVKGTGDSESLKVSLSNGLDASEQTPSIFPDNNLMNGFNRVKNLTLLGYTEWVFALYEYDESSSNEFQTCMKDALDDFRATANKGKGQKVISDADVLEIARKRFENREDREKNVVAKYIRTLNLNWSGQKIDAIAKKVVRNFIRQGNIEAFSRDEAEEKIKELGIGADLLNTKDSTRVLRLFPQIMRNFVENQSTMNLALFDSDACTHAELDQRQLETIAELKELDELIMKYAACRISNMNIKSYEIIGALSQKIVEGKTSGTLVEVGTV